MITATIVQAIVRHLLTTLGGGLLMKYGADGDTINAIVGALSTLAGLIWSLYDKKKAAPQPPADQ